MHNCSLFIYSHDIRRVVDFDRDSFLDLLCKTCRATVLEGPRVRVKQHMGGAMQIQKYGIHELCNIRGEA